jgi:autotransporter-associated beta strand protein
MTLETGGYLNLGSSIGANSQSIRSLSGTGGYVTCLANATNSSTATLTISNDAGDNATFGGQIVDGSSLNTTLRTSATNVKMALTKTGSGTQILSGNNSYSGTTTVSQGTLVVTNITLTATISNNSTLVNFATPPAVGTTNNVLSGPLNIASLASNKVTGLPPNSGWSFTNNPNLQVIVTSTEPTGPTFESAYPTISDPSEINPANGLSYLMNYALGGTGPSSTPALPVLTSDGTSLTLTANIRKSGQGVRNVVGEYAYDLAGQWYEVVLTPTEASTVENTTVQFFTQPVESDKPKKFLRLKATK